MFMENEPSTKYTCPMAATGLEQKLYIAISAFLKTYYEFGICGKPSGLVRVF